MKALEQERQESKIKSSKLSDYAFAPVAYIKEKLNWVPWESGDMDMPGQVEIAEVYTQMIRSQIEKRDFELGLIPPEELEVYNPGDDLQYIIRIPKGFNTGGTKIASALVSHFFDCFTPVTGYTFAPIWDQIAGLLWKEIISDRANSGLPGEVLPGALIMRKAANHFIRGRATQNMKGKGQESIQGQHSDYLIFVVDEAEGVEEFVFNAIDKMGSNIGAGVVIVIMLANPRSRTSRFYRMRSKPTVRNMRISCLKHPNVVLGKPVIPASVSRDWVKGMINDHCERVPEHDTDHYTFEVPWYPGIFKPDAEFLYAVLGIASDDTAINTVIPVGRYEGAVARWKAELERVKLTGWARDIWKKDRTHDPAARDQLYHDAWIGIDVARWGDDTGVIFVRWNGMLWRYKQFKHKREKEYYAECRKLIKWLLTHGTLRVRVRVDATGGYGVAIVESLEDDLELSRWFLHAGMDFSVQEVGFGSRAHDPLSYADIVTEMYFEAAETLRGLMVVMPPNELESDLTDRQYKYKNFKGRQVHKLEDKDDFRDRHKRSPDNGDGAVLAMAPDYILGHVGKKKARIGAAR